MEKAARKAAGIAGSAVLLAGGLGVTGAQAFAGGSDEAAATAEVQAEPGAQALQSVAEVRGEFSYVQGIVAPSEVIAKVLGVLPAYACGSDFVAGDAGDDGSWEIAVRGDVGSAFSATLEELDEGGRLHMVMGCSCAGNPEDGRASVNAEVAGVSVAYLLERADASPDANTVVFASADGYEVALPLSYVMQRASMIVYSINGSPLGDSVGGTNQLWLGSTAARYFVRNVESVSVETRDVAPPVPGSAEAGDAYANVPNVSIVYGGAA